MDAKKSNFADGSPNEQIILIRTKMTMPIHRGSGILRLDGKRCDFQALKMDEAASA
jgi:hypothetical protein